MKIEAAARTGGTVNIARGLWDDPEFPNEKFSEREAWIWLIAEASWKPREKRVQRTVYQLERGQLAASVRFLAEAWGWSKSRVFRFLDRLEKRDMITTQSGTDATLITVCNYDKFQTAPKQSGTAAGQVAGQQRDTSGTNEKKGERKIDSFALSPLRFEEFWQVYPHRNGAKKGKKPALASYKRAVSSGVPEEQIIAGALRYQRDRNVLDNFAKDPATWLNQAGWEDEVEPPAKTRAAMDAPHDGAERAHPITGQPQVFRTGVGGWCHVHS